MKDFFIELIDVIERVNLNQSVNQEKVSDIQADYNQLEKAKKLLALVCKKQDEDLLTMRQIRGEDYAKSVELHRKRKTDKVDPLTKLMGEMTS